MPNTHFIIPNLAAPGHSIPPGYEPLFEYVRERSRPETVKDGERFDLLTELARADHPVRLALQLGTTLEASVLNLRSGNVRKVEPHEWNGEKLWPTLIDDKFQLDGELYCLLLKEPAAAEASGTPLAPHEELLQRMSELPDFPPRIRRLVEIYYELELNRTPRVEPDLLPDLDDHWDTGSGKREPIAKRHRETIAKLLHHPDVLSGKIILTKRRAPKKASDPASPSNT